MANVVRNVYSTSGTSTRSLLLSLSMTTLSSIAAQTPMVRTGRLIGDDDGRNWQCQKGKNQISNNQGLIPVGNGAL